MENLRCLKYKGSCLPQSTRRRQEGQGKVRKFQSYLLHVLLDGNAKIARFVDQTLLQPNERLYTALTFHPNSISSGRQEQQMTKADEKKIRAVVQDELLGIISDAQESLGMKKDPTGMGRRALEGLADLIRERQSTQTDE